MVDLRLHGECNVRVFIIDIMKKFQSIRFVVDFAYSTTKRMLSEFCQLWGGVEGKICTKGEATWTPIFDCFFLFL